MRGKMYWAPCLAIDVAGDIRSGRVIEVLTQIVSLHGAPRYLADERRSPISADPKNAGTWCFVVFYYEPWSLSRVRHT
jgi:hypothetical protein